MSRYLVTWKANPSAWPTDPKQILTVLEGAVAGGNQLVQAGAAKELNWLTAQEGFGIFETDSMASVLGMVQGFFPYYSQDVREIAPWESSTQAILENARQAAAR